MRPIKKVHQKPQITIFSTFAADQNQARLNTCIQERPSEEKQLSDHSAVVVSPPVYDPIPVSSLPALE